MRLDDLSSRFYLAILIGLASIAGIVALCAGFSHTLTIQDDARQFIFWMAEWRDRSLFEGDLLAEYWQSVSPWLFKAIYRVFDLVGVEPIDAAKLLPAIVFPAAAFFAFRVARSICSDPNVAFVGALFVLIALVSDDNIISATPRAFGMTFFLVFLDGLMRRSLAQTVFGMVCAAGTYPHLAVVGAMTLAVVPISSNGRLRVDLSKKTVGFVTAGFVSAVVGLLPFIFNPVQFGPTVTPETATQFATFYPGGRSQIFDSDGDIDFVCGHRIGFVGGCDSFLSPLFLLIVLASAAAPTFFFVRWVRSGRSTAAAIPFVVGVGSVILFIIASVAAFRLHVPSRFIIRTFPVVTLLPTGLMIGEFVRDRSKPRLAGADVNPSVIVVAVIVGLVSFAVLALAQIPHRFKEWRRPELAAAISSMPKGTMIAGFLSDTDFIPVLAKRRVLFSPELAVAYHLGYYRQIEARMRDMVEVELTTDATVLTDRLQRNSVDVYLINSQSLADSRISGHFYSFVGEFIEQKKDELGDSPTALARLAPNCQIGGADGILILDARCLVASAKDASLSATRAN